MDDGKPTPGFCRDCLAATQAGETRCTACGGPRLLRHPQLNELTIAHIDCDAFYAAIEKRDNPALADRPVIVGGAVRGVVSTACYVARIRGVRSAMPMFQALKLCPDAVVLKPDMKKYSAAGQEVRAMMLELTPLVEPLSIDEAFLDLTGTARLHGMSPALSLARLARAIEKKIGITVSVGLAANKFLAKIASDLEKPRGFSVLGPAEAKAFLAAKPVGFIWGVGKATQEELARGGITMVSQLQTMEKSDLMRRYGSMGARLYHLSRGEDVRRVETGDRSKSISAETTFDADIADRAELETILWRMAERVSYRAKKEGFAGQTVTLKLKTANFRIRTRAASLAEPTLLAARIYEAALPLLRHEADGTEFRLLGVGISHLSEAEPGVETATLDAHAASQARAELAMDKLRGKFGREAIERGIVLRKTKG